MRVLISAFFFYLASSYNLHTHIEICEVYYIKNGEQESWNELKTIFEDSIVFSISFYSYLVGIMVMVFNYLIFRQIRSFPLVVDFLNRIHIYLPNLAKSISATPEDTLFQTEIGLVPKNSFEIFRKIWSRKVLHLIYSFVWLKMAGKKFST